jgi:hypothetical protein
MHGTGTLFAISDHRFLVTASHVVVPTKPEFEMTLWLIGPEGTPPVRLVGTRIVTHSPGGVDDDAADVAIWALEESTISGLGNCTFLRQSDIVADDDFAEDYYFLSGFPIEWANTGRGPERGATLVTYTTQSYVGDPPVARSYRPDWHILLALGGGMDLDGSPKPLPREIKGMSGCSIWRSYFRTQNGAETARVVAVQTGTLQNNTIIKGTRWAIVVNMLLEYYPELNKAMSLKLPRPRA